MADDAPTVLLIDDDAMVRSILGRGLESAGFSVERHGEGACIDDSSLIERIDILITDMLIPDKDGLEIARQARQQNPDLPIIVISGDGDGDGEDDNVDDPKRAKSIDVDAVFEKPVKVDDLVAKVNELLGRDAG